MVDIWKNAQQIKNMLKKHYTSHNKPNLAYWGELTTAITIFYVLEGTEYEVQMIERYPRSTPDLKVTFKSKKLHPIGIEVKTSTIKEDYIKDFWMTGIPLKKKDLESPDIIAMVNVLYINPKSPKKIKENYPIFDQRLTEKTRYIILYFLRDELLEHPFYPLYKIPIPLLLELKSKANYLKYFKKINNDRLEINYKTIILSAKIMLDILRREGLKINNGLDFLHWFGEKEGCLLIRKFHNHIKSFSQKVWKNINVYNNLPVNIKNVMNNVRKTLKIVYFDCPNDCFHLDDCKNKIKEYNLTI